MSSQQSMELDDIVFYGRTFSEYEKFFDLDIDSLRGKTIFDCPSGSSSFVAEAKDKGILAVACDPLFGPNLKALLDKGTSDIEKVIESVEKAKELFVWDHYSSIDEVRDLRKKALSLFVEDFPIGAMENRYVKAWLPTLPYEDHAFDLVLCGHFLFSYGDRLDYDFHKASILEMARICCGEVRIYPLLGLDAKPYPFMEKLMGELADCGLQIETRNVPFEFLIGANKMLCINCGREK